MSHSFKQVYQFKISLADIQPLIWRQIQVLVTYSFWDFHVAIQDAMGWLDYHLHQFEMINPQNGHLELIGIPEDEFDEITYLPGWTVKIANYFNQHNKTARYDYDFGDGWQHHVTFEGIMPREVDKKYPYCIDGKRACPPEDCGGVEGYQQLLTIFNDQHHKDYDELLKWLGKKYQSEQFDKIDIHFSNPQVRLKNLQMAGI